MDSNRAFPPLFWVSAFYDGILGIGFLLIGMTIFEWAQVTPPNHVGYVQFPGALLIIFAIMFANIARDPVANRHLIIYGILLKISYCSIVFSHWAIGGLPWIWKPFAICDILFLIAFVWAYRKLSKAD